MKRARCALGLIAFGLFVAGRPVGAEEPAAEDAGAGEPQLEEAPAPAPPVQQPEPSPAATTRVTAADAGHGITLFGELLFLKPTFDDTYFAIASPSQGTASGPFQAPPTGQRVNDDFDFEPAFRIGAAYQLPKSDRRVELAYTRLQAEATESVSGNFLWATRGAPDFAFTFGPNTGGYAGSASADIDTDYQRIDAHVALPWRVSDLDVGLDLGLEWADFRVGEEYVYVDNGLGAVGRVVAASRSWGVGPEAGLALGYEVRELLGLPGAFSLRAGSSVGLLLGETHTRAVADRTLPRFFYSVRDDDTSRVLTVIHARVGMGYQLPLADRITAAFGVGYQIDTHLNGLSRIEFPDDVGRGLASTDYYNFDLQGVYASFGVSF
jgi:hypothetical protein